VIDTLKLSQGLHKAGRTQELAEGVTNALNEAQTDYITKQDLEIAVNQLELRLSKLINDARNQMLVGLLLFALAQIGLHLWH
jgi:hypothetical protein